MAATSTATLFRLPKEDEMLARLVRVSQDPTMVRALYPQILRCAGRELSPRSFAHVLWAAVRQYRSAGGRVSATILADVCEALVDDVEEVIETMTHYVEYVQKFG